MGVVEEAIKELIGERYDSVPKFAKAIGLPEQTIYSVLRNGIMGASVNTFMPIVEGLDLDAQQLSKGKVVVRSGMARGSVEVPVFGSIAAGRPTVPELADIMFPIPRELHERYPRAFLLRVEGESMNEILPNGCYALVNPCSTVDRSNEPYAIAVGDEAATVKRVRVLSNGYELLPDSSDPTFRPTLLDFNKVDVESVRVIGEVVWYCLPTEWSFRRR